jgi:protein involved in polysaccharide export with SLBB domain
MIRIVGPLLIVFATSLGSATDAYAQTIGGENRTSPPDRFQTAKSADSTAPASNMDATTDKVANQNGAANKPVDKIARDNARRQYKAGVKYGRANLYRQAMQSFQQAVTSDPQFADAYYGLGQAYFDLGQYEEAVAAFEKAIKLDPKAADGYHVLGEAYAKLKEQKRTGQANSSAVGERAGLKSDPRSPGSDGGLVESRGEMDQTRIYRIGVGDVLDIRIPSSVSEDSTLFTVSGSGYLEHPVLAQPLKVTGLTTEEVAQLLRTEFKRRSIGNDTTPQVGIRDYNSHTILVSGLVKEPGTKILRREAIPLYVVLADAQPLPEAALATVISQGSVRTRTVDLADAEQTSLLVKPGDVIAVQPAVKQFIYVGGEVKSPGELPFRSGLSLTQAILSAGGVNIRGQRVQVMRGPASGLLTSQEYKLKEINKGKIPDPPVEPGDRITVLP